MKGLILKDILNLRKQGRIVLVMFAFYLVLAVLGDTKSIFGGIVALMTVMLTITSMAFDERSNWDKFALTMPVTRTELVLSKYLLGGILSVMALVLNLAFQLAFGAGTAQEAILIPAALFGLGFVFLSIVLPLLFKFGVEKGRLLMMLALFLPTGIILLMSRAGLEPPGPELTRFLPYLAGAAVVLMVFASIFFSLKIYRSKEM